VSTAEAEPRGKRPSVRLSASFVPGYTTPGENILSRNRAPRSAGRGVCVGNTAALENKIPRNTNTRFGQSGLRSGVSLYFSVVDAIFCKNS